MGGVKLALEELTQIEKIYLVGVPEVIEREMQQQAIPQSPKLEIVPAYQVVDMNDSGLDAVRKKKDSSISRTVDLVKDRMADAVVSAGWRRPQRAAVAVVLQQHQFLDDPEAVGLQMLHPFRAARTGRAFPDFDERAGSGTMPGTMHAPPKSLQRPACPCAWVAGLLAVTPASTASAVP